MKKVLFVEYPKCTTCQKAKKWLDDNGIAYEDRHITEQNPTVSELKQWIAAGGGEVKKFFNTSGLKYKALALKDKLPLMNEEEQIALLATDGMLVKRPLLVGDDFAISGFKPEVWAACLQKNGYQSKAAERETY
jgi:transcriptional regulator, spx/mgsR family